MVDQLHALVVGEAAPGGVKHQRGVVQADPQQMRPGGLQQRQEPPVAGAQVEDAVRLARHVVEQDASPSARRGNSSARSR